MKTSNPPVVATWMLQHLTLRSESEALAGDLLEQFRMGRRAGWYWRQGCPQLQSDSSKRFLGGGPS